MADIFGHIYTLVWGPNYSASTQSASWLVDVLAFALPGHQHLWYWLCKIVKFLSCMDKSFNWPCHVSVEVLIQIVDTERINSVQQSISWLLVPFQIAKFRRPTWGPSGSCRPQMGPMLAPWISLSGLSPCVPRMSLPTSMCSVFQHLVYMHLQPVASTYKLIRHCATTIEIFIVKH